MANGKCPMHGGASTGPRTAEGLRGRGGCDGSTAFILPRLCAEQKRARELLTRSREILETDASGLNRRLHGAQGLIPVLSHGPGLPVRPPNAVCALLAISREFGKSVDWLLIGKTHVEPKKRTAKDPANLG